MIYYGLDGNSVIVFIVIRVKLFLLLKCKNELMLYVK